MPHTLHIRPIDATLSVTKAARLLGVHPNTIRTWSDAGRLRYFRINARGDRRYRLGDLQRFLAAAEPHSSGRSDQTANGASRGGSGVGRRGSQPTTLTTATRERIEPAGDPLETEHHRVDLSVAETIARLGIGRSEPPIRYWPPPGRSATPTAITLSRSGRTAVACLCIERSPLRIRPMPPD